MTRTMNNSLSLDLSLDQQIRLLNGDGNWDSFSAEGKLPMLTMSDGPHGLRKQSQQNYADINNSQVATCFPTASASACSWNRSILYKIGEYIGLEAKANGVNLMLGPGLNIKRSCLCGRNFEYFSEDPLLSGLCASFYVQGMQSVRVGACLKHFACNNQEKRRQTCNSILDLRTLNEIYLRGFELAIRESQPAAVMTSYNRVNGIYACHSPYLLEKLKEWGFDGLVISDWGAAMDIGRCVKNGLNLAMPDSKGYFSDCLKKDLKEGRLLPEDVLKAGEKVVQTASRFPKTEAPLPEKNIHQLSVDLAKECGVLLKNCGSLPLPELSAVCAAGPFTESQPFQGGGSSHVNTRQYPGAVECLKSLGITVYEKSDRNFTNPELPVLFFCGLDNFSQGEGFDRTTLSLPESQVSEYKKLESSGHKMIVVCFGGSPMDLGFAKNASAILYMGLCGEGCGQACAELLCGKVNPSGKLAETWPVPELMIPSTENFGGSQDNILYSEGTLYGYRYYESKNLPVQFEFGFGLSYTSFEYSDIEVEEGNIPKTVSLTVKNCGRVAGTEVCQLYVKNPESKRIPRAAIQLAGFEKFFLEPGESKRVTIEVDPQAFSVYSTKQNQWAVVKGAYDLCIGSSIRDIRLEKAVAVEGRDLEELFEPDFAEPKSEWFVPQHKRGSYQICDSLGDLSRHCLAIKLMLGVFVLAIRIMNFGKSAKDPAVKIAVNAITENPVESLISTSGGMISPGFARFLVKLANLSLF